MKRSQYEVKVGGKWYPSWRRSQRPRVGGYQYLGGLRLGGKIEAVRERT